MSWIKVETTTPRKPEIFQLSEILGVSPREAFGLCFDFWAWIDEISIDGSNAVGVTKALLDRYLGVTGAADALEKTGWLRVISGGISIPNGQRHNGETAKHRAVAAKRQLRFKHENSNSNAGSVTKVTQEALPREDKIREEKNINTPNAIALSPLSEKRQDKKFQRPTLSEVTEYCQSRKNQVDPQRFLDFYESKGWKVGDQPMRDWQAAVRTWERRDNRGGTAIQKPTAEKDYSL